MNISVATATFFHLPFQEALEIISEAGFKNIELDMFWQGGDNWEMAQHLKNINPHDVIKMVHNADLRILSIHDGGGVIENGSNSAIDPKLDEYLEALNYKVECIVFHVPHKKTDYGLEWWKNYKEIYIKDLKKYSSACKYICIENLPSVIPGYYVPLPTPEELFDFVQNNDFFINMDTTHYAQVNIDIQEALEIIKNKLKSVHLSDYHGKRSHVYIGEGSLQLNKFITSLKPLDIYSLTLECAIDNSADMTRKDRINRLKNAKNYLESILNA